MENENKEFLQSLPEREFLPFLALFFSLVCVLFISVNSHVLQLQFFAQ